jgi:hypothetical protein
MGIIDQETGMKLPTAAEGIAATDHVKGGISTQVKTVLWI